MTQNLPHFCSPSPLFTLVQSLSVLFCTQYILVSHVQTFLHSAAEEAVAGPHSILGWEKNMLSFLVAFL